METYELIIHMKYSIETGMGVYIEEEESRFQKLVVYFNLLWFLLLESSGGKGPEHIWI